MKLIPDIIQVAHMQLTAPELSRSGACLTCGAVDAACPGGSKVLVVTGNPVIRVSIEEYKRMGKHWGGWDPIFWEGKFVFLMPSFINVYTDEQARRIQQHSNNAIQFIQLGKIFIPALRPGVIVERHGMMYCLGKHWLFSRQ